MIIAPLLSPNRSSIRGRMADRISGRPSRRHPAGRACVHFGCSTILSTYNGSSRCYVHRARGR